MMIVAIVVLSSCANSPARTFNIIPLDGYIADITLGNGTILATLPCGELWTWGMIVGEHYAQGMAGRHVLPIQAVGLQDVMYKSTNGIGGMSAAENHAMAITGCGTLWGWGGMFRRANTLFLK